MKCPHCNKVLEIPNNVIVNMESYQQQVLIRASCCGKGVKLAPRTVFSAYAYTGSNDVDDWGEKLTPA